MPEPHRISMPIIANVPKGERVFVQVGCNGKLVAAGLVGADWTIMTFDTDGEVGENVIEIVSTPRPRDAGAAVGVAIAPFRVGLP
jgi:hypothetical protein